MKRYIAGKTRLAEILMIAVAAFVFSIQSCVDHIDTVPAGHNFSMVFSTRAGEKALNLVPNMRLFTFYKGTSSDKMFHQEALNVTRDANKLSAKIEAGTWNMAMVSSNANFSLVAPVGNVEMQKLPMYKYKPTLSGGKSASAPEIFFQNKETPQISQNVMSTMNAQLERIVAKVELNIRKATPNFKTNGSHKILLHNVPSTVTYSGGLYPDPVTPDVLPDPLQAPVVLEDAGNGSLRSTDTLSFIIPAHQGTDFLKDAPTDTTKLKMKVTVELERINGSRFAKQAEIACVAKCNKILRVYIDVDDGIAFKTEFLPWERVTVDSELGTGYRNWLYVKKGDDGNGLSWSDPLPDITTAIDKAKILMGQNKKLNGILVAGGSSRIYDEALDLPENIKVYGGWEGTPGTELAPDDATAPYTSKARNLLAYKAYLATGAGNVRLTHKHTLLDGFVVSGSGDGSASGLVTLSDSTAWINAIEIKGQTVSSANALALSDGVATNILVSDNSVGVSVTGGGKLINATVVNNKKASVFNATLLNTVYWGNAGNVTASETIRYSAFQGTLPTGAAMNDLYPLHTNNEAWFTATNPLPGPHFNLTETPTTPKYVAGTTHPDRAPMLGRGDRRSFDDYTTAMPVAAKMDINGNPRHHEGTDIGCFESAGSAANAGFKLQWNMEALYISPKKDMESEHPAILFKNDAGAYVEWKVSIVEATQYKLSDAFNAGSGNTANLGVFKLSPTVANTLNTLHDFGSVLLSSNLGVYLPDKKLPVYQIPGMSSVWNNGYVGSFHRWNETEERYIQGTNSGDWTARVVSGIDWIKMDTNARGYNGGEVVEMLGDNIAGTGDIVFRVGMKGKLASATSQPRYGLILIQRTDGVALFFVRQGEAADYLFRKSDYRYITDADKDRNYAEKVSPYNLTDPQGRSNVASLGTNGGGFVDYPSQNGYYFQWSSQRAYHPYEALATAPPLNNNVAWDKDSDACPPGYHTPTEPAFVHSIYLNRGTGVVDQSNTNFVYGRLADGFFDKYATADAKYVNAGTTKGIVALEDAASYGLLMYNDYNKASVFFPIAGYRLTGSKYITGEDYAWYWTASPRSITLSWHTHWDKGHLGMSCTQTPRSTAASVRCFKDD